MEYSENIKVALQGLTDHKFRSFLTMLGIIFGVASVIAMLSIGEGAKREAIAKYQDLGVNNIIVREKNMSDEELEEVRTKFSPGLSLRDAGPSIISCPTCARTKVNLFETAAAVEEALEGWAFANPGCKIPKVAVMGCVVNGPGEAKDADIALCGGDGDFLLYVKGSQVCKVGAREALGKVMEYVVSL
jgi:4-hydroxy-3-methylbut-2-en-1-yl diphosphate synthase IspG/GcpE